MDPTEAAPEHSPAPRHPRLGRALAGPAALLVLCVLVYGRVVGFDFVWDDFDLVADNPYLRQPTTPWRAFGSDFWELSQGEHRSGMYRPLVTLSYWAELRVFGRSAAPFHATNLLLHFGVCLLVLALARRLGAPSWAALLGAALFALHPAQAEAVAAIASRTDLLATLLLLAGALLWLRPGRGRAAALPLLLAAILAKESALVGPILVIVVARYVQPELPRGWRALAPLAVLPVYAALRLAVLGLPALGGAAALRDTAGGLRVFRYAARVLLPLPQPAIEAPEHAAPLLAAASAVGVALVVVLLLRRRASVFAGLGAWFLVALVPVAEIAPIGVRFADLLLYLPLVAVGLAAACFAGGEARWRPALVAVLVAAAGLVTMARVPVWRDGVSLWTQGLELDPHSPRMLVNLGTALRARGRTLDGCRVFGRALAEVPGRPDPDTHVRVLYNLGNCYRERGDDEPAVASYREALQRSGGQLEPAAQNLAVSLSRLGRDAEALALVRERVARKPRHAPLWQLQATLQARLGQRDDAIRSCEEALRLEPGNREAAATLAQLQAGAHSQ